MNLKNFKFYVNCPKCGHKISCFSIFYNIVPFYFRCIKCGKFVRAKDVFWRVFFTTMVLGFPIILYLNHALGKKHNLNLNDLAIIGAMALIVSFCNAIIICNKAKIE